MAKHRWILALFVQILHSKIDISHQKMHQWAGFLLYPLLSEIAKKLGKMLKYTPHFQSAFGTAGSMQQLYQYVFRQSNGNIIMNYYYIEKYLIT